MTEVNRAARTRAFDAAGQTREMDRSGRGATTALSTPEPGRPAGLAPSDPRTAEGLEALRGLFRLAFPVAGPAARGLFELLAGGAIRPQTASWLGAQGLGIGDLLDAARSLHPFLDLLTPLGGAVAGAALDLLAEADGYEDLQPSADLEGRTAFHVANRLAGTVFPADGQDPLRDLLADLLTTGRVDPQGMGALTPSQRQEFQSGIRARGAVAVEAAAPDRRAPLADLLGAFGLETHGRAFAGADAQAGTWARSGLTLAGLEAEAGAGAGARAATGFEAGTSAFGGLVGVDIEGGASADVSATAKASGRVGIDEHGLGADVYAGAKVEANAEAHLSQRMSYLGGAVTDSTRVAVEGHAEASAEVRAVARVGLDEDQQLEVALGVDAHARAVAEARAKVRKEINFFGFKIGAEAYAGAKAGAEASAHAMFTYKDGKVTVGAGAGLAAKVGLGFGGGVSIGLPPFLTGAIDGAAKVFGGLTGLFGKKAAA